MSSVHPPGAFQPDNLPPNGRAFQPILWRTIERWRHCAGDSRDWEETSHAVSQQMAGWEQLAERIQLINAFQWHQEDRSRDPQASETVLAETKRIIDASNRRRIQAVESLDELIFTRLQESALLNEQAPLHSESPGSIVDRLSVLALKIFHLKLALSEARRQAPEKPAAASVSLDRSEPPADAQLERLYERLRSLSEQMVDLTECLDHLLADLAAGRVRMKLYRQIKVYRDPSSGRLHDDLS